LCPSADTGPQGGQMSRHLPARPSLEFLKKQAKDRLRELRQQDQDSKLADAQHAIAREYGFANWPSLSAHIEALPPDTPQVGVDVQSDGNRGGGGGRSVASDEGNGSEFGFERYTTTARRALFFSRHEASQAGSHTIAPQHLLLGLMRAARGLASQMF